MSYVDLIREGIQGGFDRVEEGLAFVERVAPPVVHAIVDTNLATILLPGPVKHEIAERILDVIGMAVDYLRKVLAFLRRMAEALGGPDALRAAADGLGSDVGDAVERIRPEIAVDRLRSADAAAWSGDGADAYRRVIGVQGDAVGPIAGIVDALTGVLRAMADQIENYYLQLAGSVTALVGGVAGLVAAIITACGVVTIPVAVIELIASVAALVGGIIGLVATLVSNAQTMREQAAAAAEDVPTSWPGFAYV